MYNINNNNDITLWPNVLEHLQYEVFDVFIDFFY